MHYWNFYSYIVENRNLESSIVGLSFYWRISNRSVILNGSGSVNRLLLLVFNFEIFRGKSGFDCVLFVDGGSWYYFLLDSYCFVELSWQYSWLSFNISFRSIYDFELNFLFVNNRLNDWLLVNGRSRNLYWSFSYSCLFLNPFENWLKFSLFDLRFINVDLLVNSVFFWLNVSVVFYFVSWNLDSFLNLFVGVLSWKYNRFSFNYFVFSVNEFWFCSNKFVQNSRLFDDLLSNR